MLDGLLTFTVSITILLIAKYFAQKAWLRDFRENGVQFDRLPFKFSETFWVGALTACIAVVVCFIINLK